MSKLLIISLGNKLAGEEGVFWMSYEDFLVYFTTIDTCGIRQSTMELRFEVTVEGIMKATN